MNARSMLNSNDLYELFLLMDLQEIANRINAGISYRQEALKRWISDSWLRKKLIAHWFDMKAKCIPWKFKVNCSYCGKSKEVEYNETNWWTKVLYYCNRRCQNSWYRKWQHLGKIATCYPVCSKETYIAHNWKSEKAKKMFKKWFIL